jgi:CheY-like chemotaxis protein
VGAGKRFCSARNWLAHLHHGDFHLPTILVVDDDTGVRDMVARAIERLGHEARMAKSGTDALTALRKETIDLVIADVYLPDMDGIEFLQRLAQEPVRPRVIVISGGGYEDRGNVLERATQLGASITMEKPFTAHQLTDAINKSLDGHGGEKRGRL